MPSIQISEAHLMLVLNNALEKVGKKSDIRFAWVKYVLIGLISALFIEKANERVSIPQLLNLLIWVAKTVNIAIVGIEILEHW